jgi:hypothetical protein
MKRVEITRIFVGICHMQVCAVSGATDEEILAKCNADNPSGTSCGWCDVVRNPEEKERAPVACEEHQGRTHFLVAC